MDAKSKKIIVFLSIFITILVLLMYLLRHEGRYTNKSEDVVGMFYGFGLIREAIRTHHRKVGTFTGFVFDHKLINENIINDLNFHPNGSFSATAHIRLNDYDIMILKINYKRIMKNNKIDWVLTCFGGNSKYAGEVKSIGCLIK